MGLTDAGITVSKDYSVTDTPPVITLTPAPIFTQGTADTRDMSVYWTDDGVSTVTSALTNVLPNGLTYNGNTHILDYDGIGAVTVSQHQLVVTDAVGQDTSASFNIEIEGVSWDAIPDPLPNGTQHDMLQYLNDSSGLVTTTDAVGISGDASYNSLNGILTYGTTPETGIQMEATYGGDDWASRSTGADVLFAHDFSESDNELEYFVRLGAQTNPDPAPLPNPLTLVTTTLGNARAIRTRAVGSLITTDLASVPKLTTGFTIPVTDSSGFPDPATLGAYNLFIGCTDVDTQNTDPEVFEEVTLTSISGNNLIVTRNIGNYGIKVDGVNYGSGDPNAPAIAASSGNYTIGYTNSGSWNRPLCCFPSGQNGKATDDIGITNGSAAKTRTWNPTRGGTGHAYFREGYFGSRWYWDPAVNQAAPYKDWTPNNAGDGQNFPHPDAFEGDEFYLQFRFKATAARLNAKASKLFYIQNAAQSGKGQLYMPVGEKKYNEQPDPADKVPGSTEGVFLGTNIGGGDPRQPAGGYLGDDVQWDGWDFPPAGAGPWQTDYPLGNANNRFDTDCYAFCHQSEVWTTLHIRIKFGRDNAESIHPNISGSQSVSAPWPGDSDASYLTEVEIKAALPGDTAYKTLVNITDAIWFHGDGLDNFGRLFYNPPGQNAFWMTQEFNMYIGSGSVAPPDGSGETQFTQVILSRSPIPVPTD